MGWKQYQEDAAELFRKLGCDAEVEAKVVGAQGEHRVDVLVRFQQFGLDSIWVIECKHWTSNITKEKVLVLKSIVDDIGADRGILISAEGFQSGAIRVAEKTNLTLTDLEGLRESAQNELVLSTLHRIEIRAVELKDALDKLYVTEQTSPWSWTSSPLAGVKANAVAHAVARLSVLQLGFDRIRLKRSPYPVKYDYRTSQKIVSDSLTDFVSAASEVIAETESILKTQLANTARAATSAKKP